MSEKIIKSIVAIALTLTIAYVLTMAINGKKQSVESEFDALETGKDILISIDGKNELIDVEKYIAGVLPYEIEATASLDVVCAQAVAIRTGIYYEMGEETVLEGSKLNYKYMSDREGEKKYGRDEYIRIRNICQRAVIETRTKTMN